MFDVVEGKPPEVVHDEALRVFDVMHALPVHDTEERARLYRDQVQGNPAVLALRSAFDIWCALWFWPADKLDSAPLPATMASLTVEGLAVVRDLVAEHRFFHWELEYPDVFAATGGGFDAIIGNPPWETLQPVSKEFFSNIDPLYRAYGKQAALQRQEELFRDSESEERGWLLYVGFYKALAAFTEYAAAPFGDPAKGARLILGRGKQSGALHELWRVSVAEGQATRMQLMRTATKVPARPSPTSYSRSKPGPCSVTRWLSPGHYTLQPLHR
ncbi:MAG: hypothetical protein IPJ95_05980 [Gemmatimonadetes bacterium]|nr:hypothetical protein [Gemmatimonadota bacterium]